jgi:hypothetical protein
MTMPHVSLHSDGKLSTARRSAHAQLSESHDLHVSAYLPLITWTAPAWCWHERYSAGLTCVAHEFDIDIQSPLALRVVVEIQVPRVTLPVHEFVEHLTRAGRRELSEFLVGLPARLDALVQNSHRIRCPIKGILGALIFGLEQTPIHGE